MESFHFTLDSSLSSSDKRRLTKQIHAHGAHLLPSSALTQKTTHFIVNDEERTNSRISELLKRFPNCEVVSVEESYSLFPSNVHVGASSSSLSRSTTALRDSTSPSLNIANDDDEEEDNDSDLLMFHSGALTPAQPRLGLSSSSVISRPASRETAPSVNLVLPDHGPCVGCFRVAVFGLGFRPSSNFHLKFGDNVYVTEIEYHCPTAVVATLTLTRPLNPSRVFVAATNDGSRYGASVEFLFGNTDVAHGLPVPDLLLSSQFGNVRRTIEQIQNDLKNVTKMEFELRKYVGNLAKEEIASEKTELAKLLPREKIPSTPKHLPGPKNPVATPKGNEPQVPPESGPASKVTKKTNLKFGPSKSKNRELKIFISSTFRDMQPDRDLIVKKIFPRIRKLCLDRDIEFSYVDYRWGVTAEQSTQNQTMLLCLRELAKSDIVLGLLGERYGWAQPDPKIRQITPEDPLTQTFQQAAKEFPFVLQYEDRSVTEVEMRMLLDKQYEGQQKAGFFFFRDQYFAETIKENKSDYLSEGPYEHELLEKLKQDIEMSDFPVNEYNRVTLLEETMYLQIKEHIDVLYPEDTQLSAFESEQFRQRRFAKKMTKIFLPDEDLSLNVDKLLNREGARPVVITGDAGSGKTAFVANWVKTHQEQHPEDIVISHFIGSTAASTNFLNLLVRLLQELQHKVGDFKDVVREAEITEKFAPILERIVSRLKNRRVIFVVDALDALEDKGSAKDLTWFPQNWPKSVKVILSTVKGTKVSEVLQRREYEFLEVKPFQEGKRKRLIQLVLSVMSKSLSEVTELKISAAPQCSNPRFLKTLLEEATLFGIFEEHNKLIDSCLEAQTTSELYEKVLLRLAAEFDKVKNGMTQLLISFLAVSRRGLYVQDELLYLMEDKGYEAVDWEPLMLSLEDMELVYSAGGLTAFSNSAVTDAVFRIFLKDKDAEKNARLDLAGFISKSAEWTDRKCEELPYQFERAGQLETLRDTISDLRAFYKLQGPNQILDLTKYWRSILTRMPETNIADIYIQKLGFTDEFPSGEIVGDVFRSVGRFLETMGLYSGAYEVFVKARYHYDSSSSSLEVARMDYSCGRVLINCGRYREAEENLQKALSTLSQEIGPEDPEVSNIENRLGSLYILLNRLQESEELLSKALRVRIAKNGQNSSRVAQTMRSMLLLKQEQQKYDEAADYGLKALSIIESIYGFDDIQTGRILLRLGHLYLLRKDYKTSLAHIERSLRIHVTVCGAEHPETADVKYELGCLYLCKPEDLGKADTAYSSDLAEDYLKEAMEIKRKRMGSHPDYARVAVRMASCYVERGDFMLAEPLYLQALKIYEDALGSDHPRTLQVLRHMITLYEIQEEWDAAQKFASRALKIAIVIFGKDSLPAAGLYSRLGDLYMGLEGETSQRGLEAIEDAIAIYEKRVEPTDPRLVSLKKLVEEIKAPKKEESVVDIAPVQTLKRADFLNQCQQQQQQEHQIQQQAVFNDYFSNNMPQQQQNDFYGSIQQQPYELQIPSYNSGWATEEQKYDFADDDDFEIPFAPPPPVSNAPPPPAPPPPALSKTMLPPPPPPIFGSVSRNLKFNSSSIRFNDRPAAAPSLQAQLVKQKEVVQKEEKISKPQVMQHKKKSQGNWYLQNYNRVDKKLFK